MNVGQGQFHERAQAAGLVDDVRSGLQIEVIGIGQQRLGSSSRIVSGRTAFTDALVPTAMNGVRMSPCGV